MTVKTKSIWPDGDGLLETPDEELVGRRHLVIREASDWHIPRSNHADNIIASFLTLNERRRRWDGEASWSPSPAEPQSSRCRLPVLGVSLSAKALSMRRTCQPTAIRPQATR
jgi:hypothetical protein